MRYLKNKMAKITYRTILVIGDNHEEIVKKYSADTKVKKYIKMKFADAEKEHKKHVKLLETILTDKRIPLSDSQYDIYKEMYLLSNTMDDFQYFREITDGCEYDEETVDSFYNRLFRKNLRYDNNIIMENIITRNQFNRLENSIPIIDNNIYNTTASLPDIHNPNIISTFSWLASILGISITALISYLYYRFYRKEDNNNSNSEGNTTYLDKNHQEINFDDIEKQIKQTDDELRFRGK